MIAGCKWVTLKILMQAACNPALADSGGQNAADGETEPSDGYMISPELQV